jgi:LPS export ABC transporter protein LptC
VIGRIVIGLVVIGAIVGALILGQGPGASLARQGAEKQNEDVPGYSARDAQLIQTGDDGRPAFTVNARNVRQRANDSRIQLDAPHMTFLTSESGVWRVEARSGLIQADGSKVDLFGDVKMNGALAGTPVVIGTSIMAFDTREEIASTEAPVTFDARGGTLAATGLVANFKDGSVRLESHVNGTFTSK